MDDDILDAGVPLVDIMLCPGKLMIRIVTIVGRTVGMPLTSVGTSSVTVVSYAEAEPVDWATTELSKLDLTGESVDLPLSELMTLEAT